VYQLSVVKYSNASPHLCQDYRDSYCSVLVERKLSGLPLLSTHRVASVCTQAISPKRYIYAVALCCGSYYVQYKYK
jgi:hypothetical protein